jgi:hypothetical protein
MKTLFAKGSLLATTPLVCGATGEVAAQQSSALVIQGGTLVDGNGGPPLANAVIVIQGNRRARGFINLQGGGPDGKRLSAPEWGAVSNELRAGAVRLHEQMVAQQGRGRISEVRRTARAAPTTSRTSS